DLVAERLADLRDPDRGLPSRELEHVLEVDEDSLRGLWPEVGGRPRLFDRAEPRRQHQVELTRLRQVAVRCLARMLARLAAALRLVECVGAKPQLARPAIDERIAEPREVARRLPHGR